MKKKEAVTIVTMILNAIDEETIQAYTLSPAFCPAELLTKFIHSYRMMCLDLNQITTAIQMRRKQVNFKRSKKLVITARRRHTNLMDELFSRIHQDEDSSGGITEALEALETSPFSDLPLNGDEPIHRDVGYPNAISAGRGN